MGKHGIEVRETVDAKKQAHDRARAKKILASATRVVAAKGKKVVEFHLKKNPGSSGDALAAILGHTGNLRAPTIVRGKTLLVGFNQEAYDDVLG